MHGLTVRWSLADAPAGVDTELAAYVADTSPVSQLTGAGPVLIEECTVVGVAEGGDGFRAAARY